MFNVNDYVIVTRGLSLNRIHKVRIVYELSVLTYSGVYINKEGIGKFDYVDEIWNTN